MRWLRSVNHISILWKVSISYFFVISIIILYVYYNQYTVTVRNIEETQERLLQSQLNTVTYDLEKKEHDLAAKLETLSNNNVLRKYLEYYAIDPEFYYSLMYWSLGHYLTEFGIKDPLIHSLRIYKYDRNVPGYGNIMYDIDWFEKNEWRKDIEKIGLFDTVLVPPHPYLSHVSSAKTSTETELVVVSLYARIPNIGMDHSLGIAEVNIAADSFFEIVRNLEDKGVQVVIKDASGNVIVNTGSNPELAGLITPPDNAKGVITTKLNHRDENFIVVGTTSTSLNLSVSLALQYSQVSLGIQERTKNIIYTLILVLLSMFLLTYIISKLIFGRLNRLLLSMRAVEKGDFSVQVEEDYRDEIGRIKFAFNKMIKRIDNLVNTVYKAQLIEKETTLSSLRAQMDPHFLMNSLEAVRMIAVLHGDRKVSEALYSLSNIYRSRIQGQKFVKLQDELEVASSYIFIQNIRYNGKIGSRIEIPDRLNAVRIPSLLLQPLVENCVVHGFSGKMKDYRIMLSASLSEDESEIRLIVSDNGKGMTPERLAHIRAAIEEGRAVETKDPSRNGIALVNLAERNKLYYGDSRFTINSSPGEGTEIVIRLPVE